MNEQVNNSPKFKRTRPVEFGFATLIINHHLQSSHELLLSPLIRHFQYKYKISDEFFLYKLYII